MKIEDNRTNENVSFMNLSVGDCFIYDDECYIKIDNFPSDANAFNLERNEKEGFSCEAIVILVNAKVVIE